MEKLYNGFNNGRDRSDGIGGKPVNYKTETNMEKQTALNSLINDLTNFLNFPLVDKASIEAAIEFCKLRIDDEKQQIVEAWDDGNYKQEARSGEEYYETYKTKEVK